MTHSPILRIECRVSKAVKFGTGTRPGILISADDFRMLHLLTERDLSVTFVCAGRPVYEGRVKELLQRGVPLVGHQEWYLPTTLTGPLKPPRLPTLAY
jgi:hypothetical protein